MDPLDRKQNMVLSSRPSRTQATRRRVEPDPPFHLCLAALLALTLSGCALAASEQAPPWPAQEAYETRLAERYAAGLPAEAAETVEGRNRAVDDLLYLCNVVYRDYEVELYTSGALFDTVADLAAMSTSAAGAVVGGGAAQVASGVVAGILGVHNSVDKNFYREQSRIALLTKTDALRTTKLAEIQELKQEPLDVWPLSAAMLDVQAYYEAGTLLAALKAVTEQSGAELSAAKAKLAAQR